MLGTFIGVLAGFAGGVLYSRGKADPVQAAWFDLKRGFRAVGRTVVRASAHMAKRVRASRRWRATLVCTVLVLAPLGAMAQQQAVNSAIVKVYSVVQHPDYFCPWRMLPSFPASGSGCVIEGNRILTCAHLVADSTFVEVRKHGDWKRYPVTVQHISHQADLALLTVDDARFYEGVVPLSLNGMPMSQQEVAVYGFPAGGDSLSITKGIVSRVEHQVYSHAGTTLLAAEIDAAINGGNSGGPVIVDGAIVGIIMQASGKIGAMVPVPVIEHFFTDISDGQVDGCPDAGVLVQNMDSHALKDRYGMTESQTGALVYHVSPGHHSAEVLRKGDVLLAIDKHPIADDATVEIRPRERTLFTYFADLKQVGETVSLDILRNGTVRTVSVRLDRQQNSGLLVPTKEYGRRPRYTIYQGFVFTVLSLNLLEMWGNNWVKEAPPDLVDRISDYPTEERSELVILSQVLATQSNRGYHGWGGFVVEKLDGTQVKSLKNFHTGLRESTNRFAVVENQEGLQVVIDRGMADVDQAAVLDTYGIPEQGQWNLE